MEGANESSAAAAASAAANPGYQVGVESGAGGEETGVVQHSKPKVQSGLLGASANLVNSIVGAGIIGIPYALKQSGLVFGVFLLALVSYMTDKSLRLIVDMASFHPKFRQKNVHTYESLAWYPFGRIGENFILFNMFVMAYGAMVAYLLIIKDTVPTILGLGDGIKGGIERELIMVLTSVGIILPLAMQRDMATLAYTSALSITADVILVGFVAGFAPVKDTVSDAGGFGKVLKEDSINPTLFIGLGILSTAMACQHSAFIVSGSLENKTRARWSMVTGRSLGVSFLLCAILGICGYLGYLDETFGDVLNNFESGSVAANGARGLLAVTMFFTYPMESFVARHVWVALRHAGDMDGDNEADRWRRHKATLYLYICALIPALIVDDLGPVLSITGSLGGSCISFIAPGALYLGVHGDVFLEKCQDMTRGKQQNDRQADGGTSSAGAAAAQGEFELPVVGDASRRNDTNDVPVEGEHREIIVTETGGCKPLWWYIFLFPVWTHIARMGSQNLNEKLGNLEDQIDEETEPDPKFRDFALAIFFIVFGVVGGVAGVASNVYVQINDIFFTPH